MTLHPQSRSFLASQPAQAAVDAAGFGLEQIRERRAEARRAALAEPRGSVAHVADLDAAGVPVRLYRPRAGAPVVLHLHGGGWVFGDLESHDRFCRAFVASTGRAVLAVDYRRAPEHPYPAPLDDCEAAGGWLREHAAELDVDASRLVVMGDSSGANLAAGLAVRRPGWFSLQVLVYPCLDPSGDTPSFREENAGLTGSEVAWFWSQYVPESADRRRPDAAPALADVRGLPAAVVLTAEHDPLRDEGEAYAARLAEAGVPVVATRWQGMVHGFWRMPYHFDAARAAVGLVAVAMEEARGA